MYRQNISLELKIICHYFPLNRKKIVPIMLENVLKLLMKIKLSGIEQNTFKCNKNKVYIKIRNVWV